jgi:hypothetical protein
LGLGGTSLRTEESLIKFENQSLEFYRALADKIKEVFDAMTLLLKKVNL